MMWRRWMQPWLMLLVLLCSVSVGHGEEIQVRAKALIRAADLGKTEVGLYAIDLTDGAVLVDVDADRQLIPASNMKLLTTATALSMLGPDYRFRTELILLDHLPTGPAVATHATAGHHESDHPQPGSGSVLLIKGDGDPGFGDPKLLQRSNLNVEQFLSLWVDAVKKQNIQQVSHLIVDDRVFDREWVHATWPENQLQAWYCAQVSGLNFYDNCVDVFAEPTTAGQPPVVRTIPAARFLSITNRAVTGEGNTFWVNRKIGTNEFSMWGKVKARRHDALSVTVHDPAMFFAQLLAERLAQAGITVGVVERIHDEAVLPSGKPILTVQTPLSMILQRCNKDSQNLFAEALIKRTGRHLTGAPGSWESGAAAVRVFLRNALGTYTSAVSVVDGSGMSRENKVTAHILVDLLQYMSRDPKLGRDYMMSLSIGGVDGTLKRRFRDQLSGRVLGKSGYIDSVCSLSGYLVIPGPNRINMVNQDASVTEEDVNASDAGPASGAEESGVNMEEYLPQPGDRVIAFAFLMNHFKPPLHVFHMRKLQDQLLQMLYEGLTPAVGSTSPTKMGG